MSDGEGFEFHKDAEKTGPKLQQEEFVGFFGVFFWPQQVINESD